MFTAQIHQRFNDLDVLGHVNNVAYIEYLQEARGQFLTSAGQVDFAEPGQVVAKMEITYRKPLGLNPSSLPIRIWPTRVRDTSYVLAYEIVNEVDEVAAEASTVMVVVDLATGRPTAIPEQLRSLLVDSIPTE